MSKVAIKGAATGTGVFTLESPATNTDRTLTIPDVDGTIVTEDALGAIDVASYKKNGVAGKLLVNFVTRTDGTNYTNTGFTNTFMSDTLTFTPASADSQISVSINAWVSLNQTGSDNDAAGNLYAYSVESNGTTLVDNIGLTTGTSDNSVGFLDQTAGGQTYHCVSIDGSPTRASDGNVYVRLYGSLISDATSGYAATMTMTVCTATFKEFL